MTCSVRQRKNKSLPYTLAKRETQRASHGWTILPFPSQSVYCSWFHLFLKNFNQRRHSLDALVWKLTINEELILVLSAPPFQALVLTVHFILVTRNYWLRTSHCLPLTPHYFTLHVIHLSFLIDYLSIQILRCEHLALHFPFLSSHSSLFIFSCSLLNAEFSLIHAFSSFIVHTYL